MTIRLTHLIAIVLGALIWTGLWWLVGIAIAWFWSRYSF